MNMLEELQTQLSLRQLKFDASEVLIEAHEFGGNDWWHAGGNRLYLAPGAEVPQFDLFPGLAPPRKAIVAIGSRCTIGRFFLWGEAPIVCIGHDVVLPESEFACGDYSTVIVHGNVSGAEGAQLNARNGGYISIGKDGLWSSYVTLYTDDMHAICDATTGRRINPRGGKILVEDHVWLGYEAMVMRSAHIGRDTIVGARSMVTSDLPSNTVCAGVPARPLRSGVTWNGNDLPLEPVESMPLERRNRRKTFREILGFRKREGTE